MKMIEYSIEGTNYDEKLSLYWANKLIFYGFTDDLFSSITEELEMKILSDKVYFSYKLRLLDDYIVLIPNVNDEDLHLFYKNNFLSIIYIKKPEFVLFWQFLRYNEEDLTILPTLQGSEAIFCWLLDTHVSFMLDTIKNIDIFFDKSMIEVNNIFINRLQQINEQTKISILIDDCKTTNHKFIDLIDNNGSVKSLPITYTNEKLILFFNAFCIELR